MADDTLVTATASGQKFSGASRFSLLIAFAPPIRLVPGVVPPERPATRALLRLRNARFRNAAFRSRPRKTSFARQDLSFDQCGIDRDQPLFIQADLHPVTLGAYGRFEIRPAWMVSSIC